MRWDWVIYGIGVLLGVALLFLIFLLIAAEFFGRGD